MQFILDNWTGFLLVASALLNVLQFVVAKTKNKVDDAVVDVLKEGLEHLPKEPPKLK